MTEFEAAIVSASEAWNDGLRSKKPNGDKIFPRDVEEILSALQISPDEWVALSFITGSFEAARRKKSLLKAKEFSMKISPQVWFGAFVTGNRTEIGRVARVKLLQWAGEDKRKLAMLISGHGLGKEDGYYKELPHCINQRHTLPFWAFEKLLKTSLTRKEMVWLLAKYGKIVHGEHRDELIRLLIPEIEIIGQAKQFPYYSKTK